MPLIGKMGYHELPLYIDDIESGLSGEFSYTPRRAGGDIVIHTDQHGVHFLDSVIHELTHGSGRFRGIEGRRFTHQSIYTLSGDLAEWLVSSGAIDVNAFEARCRRLAKKKAK